MLGSGWEVGHGQSVLTQTGNPCGNVVLVQSHGRSRWLQMVG
jgi:hypothetical protein